MLQRLLGRIVNTAGYVVVGGSLTALYLDAPEGDHGDGKYDANRRHDSFPQSLHNIGRMPLMVGATAISKFYMNVLNKLEHEGLDNLIVAAEKRPINQSLITVSNHTATVDDPAVFCTMLPWWYSVPRNARWSLVSQEYSYTKNGLVSAFFFASKTLPVKRGGGIDQPMLRNLFEKVQEGEWVHVFPEGKIEQRAILGGRTGPRVKEIGRLKWGTAKLIARADVRPVVIPIYHINMQQVMPQNEQNKLISIMPRTGVDVSVRVGKPIDFEDLFEKYAANRVIDSEVPSWETQEKEKELYAAITKRIETALLELAKDFYKGP